MAAVAVAVLPAQPAAPVMIKAAVAAALEAPIMWFPVRAILLCRMEFGREMVK
jgi:hypothetical protein